MKTKFTIELKERKKERKKERLQIFTYKERLRTKREKKKY